MLIGLLLVAAPFYRILLFSDRALFYRDLARDILPAKLLWAESVAAGHGIPHWNHYAFSGVPFWAVNVEGPLHPLNFLFLIFSPEEAPRTLSLFLWIHYLAFFLGWRFLFRKLNCRPLLASLGAAMVTISGWSLSLHSLAHLLGSVAVVPWFLWLLLTWLRERKRLTLVLLSGSIAWPVYAGDPQVALPLAALAAGAILLSHRPLRSRLSDVALLALLSFLASAAQLLPTWDLLRRSTRQSIEMSETLLFSLHPLRLLETVFPVFFGNHFDDRLFWGAPLVNFPYPTPFIFSVHLSPALLLGALLWLQQSKKWRWPALAAGALLLLAALGSHGPVPLYEWTARWIPLFGKFRYPERLIVWLLLAVSLAGVCGWRSWRYERAQLWGGLLAGVALAAGSLAAWLVPETLRRGHVAQESLIRGMGVWLASAALIALLKKERLRPFLLALLAFLWFGDAVLTGTRLVWDQNKHVASHSRYPLIQDLKTAMTAEHELISRGGAHRFSTNSMTNYLFPSGRIPHSSLSTFAAYQNLVPNVGAGAGLYDIAGYFSIVPQQRFLFDSLFFQNDDLERRLSIYNNLMAAAWVPERNTIQQVVLRRNPDSQPAVHAPRAVHHVAGLEKTVAAILGSEFSSAHDAAIEMTAPDMSVTPVRQKNRGQVDQLVRAGKEIRFRWKPDLAGKKQAPETWIVVNESHDPHWKAWANGAPTPIRLANGWAMALAVPGRDSEILLRYENPWIPRGVAFTFSWLFALLWLAVSTALGRPARRVL